jgi:hypothetical protein
MHAHTERPAQAGLWYSPLWGASTLRQRQYQLHDERGRIFEWPTSATPGAGRRHAKFKFRWARIVRRMRARNRCSEWHVSLAFRRCPIDELRPLCHAL